MTLISIIKLSSDIILNNGLEYQELILFTCALI